MEQAEQGDGFGNLGERSGSLVFQLGAGYGDQDIQRNHIHIQVF